MAAIAVAQAAPTVSIACGDVAGLISAMTAANLGGPNTIDLASNCTYTLTAVNNTPLLQGSNGLPRVLKSMTLTGSNTTIERDSSAPNFRIFQVSGTGGVGATLTLDGITVSNGHTSGLLGNAGRGGCVLISFVGATAFNTLDLQSSEIENCTALSGGGVYAGSRATLLADSSKLNDNSAASGGGADIATTASAHLSHSFVNDNSALRGGGLQVFGFATLVSSTLAGDSATIAGGGVYNDGTTNLGASYVLGDSTLLAGGGIYATSSAETNLAGTRVQNNIALVRGGGLDNNGDASLVNSFVISNSAVVGGGIFESLSASIVVINSLIAGNTVNNCSPPASVPSCVN